MLLCMVVVWYPNPGQNQKTRIGGNQMKTLFSDFGVPVDKIVTAFSLKGRSGPRLTRNTYPSR